MAERSAWEDRLRRGGLDWGRATLELLRPDEERAEKAFHEDPRLRSLTRQHLTALGIEERMVEYSPDERTAEERMTDEFLGVLRPGR